MIWGEGYLERIERLVILVVLVILVRLVILVILVILELLALYILYLVNENFILNPKSCVVVGYELDDSNGVLVCLS